MARATKRKRAPKRNPSRRPGPPASALREPWLIADLAAIPGVPCPCGSSRRAFIRPDNRVCSIHRVTISKDARAHYHKRLTETYYVLEGEGRIELNGELHPIRPGTAVMIRPGTRHRAVAGDAPLTILVIAAPPFDTADEWED
jgi:mannose-6-phosphate isomerase-like protein (cupin superfamily)